MGPERNYPYNCRCPSWVASARVRALTLEQIRITTSLIRQLLDHAPSPSFSSGSMGFDWRNSAAMLLTQLYNLGDSLLDGYREEIDIRISTQSDEMQSDDSTLRHAFLDARARVVEPFRTVMDNQLADGNLFSKFITYVFLLVVLLRIDGEDKPSIVASAVRKHSLHRLAKGHLLKLAEKHMDFDVLIEVCETQGDEASLREYMRRYRSQGFAQHLFQWYLANGMSFPFRRSTFASNRPFAFILIAQVREESF